MKPVTFSLISPFCFCPPSIHSLQGGPHTFQILSVASYIPSYSQILTVALHGGATIYVAALSCIQHPFAQFTPCTFFQTFKSVTGFSDVLSSSDALPTVLSLFTHRAFRCELNHFLKNSFI